MKQSKQYTVAEVGELLGVNPRTLRDYVYAGLIKVSKGEGWAKISKEELDRIKREGVIRSRGKVGRPSATAASAKKTGKTSAKAVGKAGKAAKKSAKRSAVAATPRTAAKKSAKRGAGKPAVTARSTRSDAATRTAVKKSAKRGVAAHKTAAKKRAGKK